MPDSDHKPTLLVVARLADFLPPLQTALAEARTPAGWDSKKLNQIIAHEFNFLGPFVSARIEVGTDASPGGETLVLEFAPPATRDLGRAERTFGKATQRAERGDAQGARRDLESLAKDFPEISKYRRALGQAYLVLGDFSRAEDELLRSLALDPRDPDALTLLGNLYTRQDKPAKAIPLYERSLDLSPNVYAMTNLGAAMAETGDTEGAVNTLREAVALDPQYPNAWFGLGLTLSRMEDLSVLPEAISVLDGALRTAGDNVQAAHVRDTARKLLNGLVEIEAREKSADAAEVNQHVAEVESMQGDLPVQIEDAPLSGILAKIELGWVHRRPYHRLLVGKGGVERAHLIRHELEHLRLAKLARAEGVNKWFGSTPASREKGIRSIDAEIKKLSKRGLPEAELTQIVLSWVDGILSQLYNFPVDFLIEERLLNEHPALRDFYYYSLKKQLETSAKIAADSAIASMTPRVIYRANTAMNGAFALWFEDRFPRRTDFTARFAKTETWGTSKRLYSMWSEAMKQWRPGAELGWVDEWAKVLNLTGWYDWSDGNN